MNKKKLLFGAFVIVVCFIFMSHNAVKTTSPKVSRQISSSQSGKKVLEQTTIESSQSSINKVKSEKFQNLDKLTGLISQILSGKMGLNSLLVQLREAKQNPYIARQVNPDTGELIFVRTRNPLPGTRYFHSQFYSTESPEKYFLQHMSFEIQSGGNAFTQSIKAIQAQFGNLLSEPIHTTSKFISWKLKPNYTLWIKELEKSDLLNNPFNSYSDKDIGTIKVALEINVHEDN